MMRITLFFSLIVMMLATSVPALCQGIPGSYPPPLPSANPCVTGRPAPPIARTVQVDVPVPCPPVSCGPPPCAPPCPTQPVQVRVDVVVRPEAPKSCPPQRFCCENPPIFEPIFCQAAGLVEVLDRRAAFPGREALGSLRAHAHACALSDAVLAHACRHMPSSVSTASLRREVRTTRNSRHGALPALNAVCADGPLA